MEPVGVIPVSAIDPRFYFHTHTLCAPGQLAEATRRPTARLWAAARPPTRTAPAEGASGRSSESWSTNTFERVRDLTNLIA
jgi:hypothetical protein